MSDAEQQYMETSENGHEDDLNGAEQYEEGSGDVQAAAQGDAGADDAAGDEEDPQNGSSDGGQIDASRGEEDAGYVKGKIVLNAGT